MQFQYSPAHDNQAEVEKLRFFYESCSDFQLVSQYNSILKDFVLTGNFRPRLCHVIAMIMKSRFSDVPIRIEGIDYEFIAYAWMENRLLNWISGFHACRMNVDTAVQVYVFQETEFQISTLFVAPEVPSCYLRLISVVPTANRPNQTITLIKAIELSVEIENEFIPFWVSFSDQIDTLQMKWKKYKRTNEAPYFIKITKKNEGYWRIEPSEDALFRRFITKQLVIPQPDVLVPQIYERWFEGS